MNRIANRRLWRTADDIVVEDGDPAAKLLLAAGDGDEIDPLLDHIDVPAKFLQKAGKAGSDDGDEKAAAKPADKSVSKAANK